MLTVFLTYAARVVGACVGLILGWVAISFVFQLLWPWVRVGFLLGFKLFGRFFDGLWKLTKLSKAWAERFEKWAGL